MVGLSWWDYHGGTIICYEKKITLRYHALGAMHFGNKFCITRKVRQAGEKIMVAVERH